MVNYSLVMPSRLLYPGAAMCSFYFRKFPERVCSKWPMATPPDLSHTPEPWGKGRTNPFLVELISSSFHFPQIRFIKTRIWPFCRDLLQLLAALLWSVPPDLCDRSHQFLLLVFLGISQAGIAFPRVNWGLGCLISEGSHSDKGWN